MTFAMELERWKRACRAEEKEKTSVAIATSMLEKGITPDIVVSCTNLSMERILSLQQELHAKQERPIS